MQQIEPLPTDLYHQLDAFLVALGDVQVNATKTYIAYRRIKNFACVGVYPKSKEMLVWVKIDPKTLELEAGFTRDVSAIGHAGTGDLQITIGSVAALEKSKPLLAVSYAAS